jgi:tetratricopeptide (TPR) repeat protein
VQAVLAARIDRLAPTEKQLLQSAAVIGKDVPLVLLEALAKPDADVRPGLSRLQAAEFLYETTLFPEPEYTFKHALTLEVAYQSLLRERRRTLHEQVLGALERLFADRVAEKIELLAHHAVRGEVWDRAARYLYQAGEKALAQGRPHAGAAFFSAAIEALDHLGEAGDRTLKLDAYLDLWVTKLSTNQLDGLREVVEKAEALARTLNDGPRLAKVQVRQAQGVALMGLLPGTLESAMDQAREAFLHAEPEDLRTRSYARFIAAVCCRDLGRLADAVGEFGAGVALFPPLAQFGGDPGLVFPIYASLCGWRSEVHAAGGAFDEAVKSASEALRVATEIRHPYSLTLGNAFLGYCYVLKGDLATAVPLLERGLTIAQEHELPHGITANELYLAYALILLGERERGLEHLGRVLQKPGALMTQWTRYGTVPASAYLAARRPAEARAEIDKGLVLVAEREARGYRGPLLRLRAEVQAASDPFEAAAALAALEEARGLAIELDMRLEAAHVRAALGRAYRRAADRARAQGHLDAAAALFRELGAPFWAERVAALLS